MYARPAQLVEFLENAQLSVFERYNIVSAGDLKDAARKLDMAGQGQNRQFDSFAAISVECLNV